MFQKKMAIRGTTRNSAARPAGRAGETVKTTPTGVLVKVGAGRRFFEELQRRRVIVRPMDGYGLPEYVRVSVGTADEMAKFKTAFLKVMTA